MHHVLRFVRRRDRKLVGTTFRRLDRDESEKWGYVRTWRQRGPPDDTYRDTDMSIRRFQPQVEMHFSVSLHRVDEKQCTCRFL
jgi:hypothetical protein